MILFLRYSMARPQEIMQYHTCKGNVCDYLLTMLHCVQGNSEAISQDHESVPHQRSVPGYSIVTNRFISGEGSPRKGLNESWLQNNSIIPKQEIDHVSPVINHWLGSE